MTTSFFSSRSPCPLLLALLLGGCAEEGPSGEACLDDGTPTLQGPGEETLFLARATLDGEVTFDAAGQPQRQNAINASFVDLSSVVVSSRTSSSLPGGTPGCYGLTGALTNTCRPGFPEPCRPEGMTVEGVTVSGIAGGPVTLAEASPGHYSKSDLPDDPFSGDAAIKVAVTSQSAPGHFPPFELSLDPPRPLEVLAPVPGTGPLGSSDLQLRWKKGNGDFVRIEVAATGTTTDKIQCLVLDDGCHTILIGDLDFYDIKPGVPFKLTISREKGTFQALDGRTWAEMKVMSRVEMTLTL